MKNNISKRKNAKRKSKFWLIYGLVCAIVVTIITVLLFVLYGYVHNFEQYAFDKQDPDYAIRKYIDYFDNATITELAEEAVAKLDLVYEKPDKYIEFLVNNFDKDEIKTLKDSAASNDKFISLDIWCKGQKYMKLSFIPEKVVKYGISKWKIESAELYIDGIVNGGKDYTLYIPHGSSFKVNGFTPEPSLTNITSPLANKLEENNLGTYDVYKLGTLYSEPEFYCDYDGGNYSLLNKEDGIHFFNTVFAPKNFSVTAPADAEVFVNGILLDRSYLAEETVYNYAPIENVTADTPKYSVYSTGELFSSPEITAKLGEVELIGTVSGDNCSFKYPDDMMYSLTVEVPKGTEVTVGGIKLNDICAAEEIKAFGELTTVTDQSPLMERYFIDSLFTSKFDVKATLEGEALNITCKVNGNEIIYNADQSTTVSPNVADFALEYIKVYFHYTSSGYRNVDANLNAALAYIESGSDFYKKVKDSKIGYEFVTPVSSEVYKVLEVSQIYEMSDGTYVVKINFDVEQTIVYVKRNYSGELLLHITGGDMKVRDMVIDSTATEE
ncbi:MAG: hypothetical protein IKM46_00120 [Clostridia bacterium]|nr:hypothetical protein [Clostridia bacterium]